MKTLSICIPTFDRPAWLLKALNRYEEILTKNALTEQVEICISDNSENNITREAVRQFSQHSRITIRYRKNRRNMGYDRNLLLALGMAKGEYLHQTSDEDEYLESMMLWMLWTIHRKKPDVILISMPAGIKDKEETWDGNIQEHLLEIMGRRMLYPIRYAIMRRKELRQFPNPKGFIGCAYIHIAIGLNAMKHAKTAVITEMPMSNNNTSITTYHPSETVIFYENIQITMALCLKERIITTEQYRTFFRKYRWYPTVATAKGYFFSAKEKVTEILHQKKYNYQTERNPDLWRD